MSDDRKDDKIIFLSVLRQPVLSPEIIKKAVLGKRLR